MKRLILLAFLLVAGYSAFAQDIITKKDGTDIKAKISEVGTTEVKYKNFSNLDGPVYTISKSDILMITYENGERDIFNTFRQYQIITTYYTSFEKLQDRIQPIIDNFRPTAC